MPTADEHGKILDRLRAALRRRPMTAKQVAEESEISRPAAYARIRALMKRGDQVFELPSTATGTGPRPIAYGVR